MLKRLLYAIAGIALIKMVIDILILNVDKDPDWLTVGRSILNLVVLICATVGAAIVHFDQPGARPE